MISNLLDINFIQGDIQGWLCKKQHFHDYYGLKIVVHQLSQIIL